VRVVTTRGLELLTESLVYSGSRARRAATSTSSSGGGASGSSTGILYRRGGDLTLWEKERGPSAFERRGRAVPPTEVHADSGSGSRSDAIIPPGGERGHPRGRRDQDNGPEGHLQTGPRSCCSSFAAVFVDDTELTHRARRQGCGRRRQPWRARFSGDRAPVLKSRKLDVFGSTRTAGSCGRRWRCPTTPPWSSGPGRGGERHEVSARVLTPPFRSGGPAPRDPRGSRVVAGS
jgi:hypothetical protein